MARQPEYGFWAERLKEYESSIAKWRLDECSWADIAVMIQGREGVQCSSSTVRKWWHNRDGDSNETKGSPENEGAEDFERDEIINRQTFRAPLIRSIEDLFRELNIDETEWEVTHFRPNYWEAWGGQDVGVVSLMGVRPQLRRKTVENDPAKMQELFHDLARHLGEQAPGPRPQRPPQRDDEPHLHLMGIVDVHVGMQAWAEETGGNYDVDIACRDAKEASAGLIASVAPYRIERTVVLVGNDNIHIDHLEKGKIGTTTSGTPQDVDSRPAKIFRRAIDMHVQQVEDALAVSEYVDVITVPGNHDEHTSVRLGEVIKAWYRNEPRVTVDSTHTLRKFYPWGDNLLMFTHGLEVTRKREHLAFLMLDEAPDQGIDLREHRHREVITGHNHSKKRLEHAKRIESVSESRGVRIRSLPALTAVDYWHKKQGYAHTRAATGLVYRKSGGVAAEHEWIPKPRNG